MVVQLYLVRHGETPMNKAQRMQGITDAVLTDKGKESARDLGKVLSEIPFDAVYASDRKRAQQTARLILSENAKKPVIQTESGLREYYFGALEGMTSRRVMAAAVRRFGMLTMAKTWTSKPDLEGLVKNFQHLDETGQAESFRSLTRRMTTTLKRIVSKTPDGGRVLVVSHGLALAAFINAIDESALPSSLLKNTSVTRVDATGKDFRLRGVNLTDESAILNTSSEEPIAH